jgi:hypothetical protein
MARAEGNDRWQAIKCLEGVVWVTQAWDPQDHIITAGHTFRISQPGKVIALALVSARIQITPTPATAPFGGRMVNSRISMIQPDEETGSYGNKTRHPADEAEYRARPGKYCSFPERLARAAHCAD